MYNEKVVTLTLEFPSLSQGRFSVSMFQNYLAVMGGTLELLDKRASSSRGHESQLGGERQA